MDRQTLIQQNDAKIYENTQRDITGQIMHDHLQDIINAFGLVPIAEPNDPDAAQYENGQLWINTSTKKIFIYIINTWLGIISKNNPSIYATIGTGGDYATITDAINAGKKRMILISDIIEINDINLNDIYYIDLNNHILNVDIYQFTGVSGDIYMKNGTITFAYSVSANLFENNFTYLENIIINNNSTTSNCRFVETAKLSALRSIFNIPNQADCGFGENNDFNLELIDCTINGGGNLANHLIFQSTGSTGKIINLIVNAQGTLVFQSNKSLIAGITITNSLTNLIIASNLGGVTVSKVYSDGKIQVDKNNSIINFKCSGILSSGGKYINGIFTNNVTDSNNYSQYNNITFDGNLTINANNITIDNCILDNETITINAIADKTVISNTRTLTPIIDNGTNTQLISNNLI